MSSHKTPTSDSSQFSNKDGFSNLADFARRSISVALVFSVVLLALPVGSPGQKSLVLQGSVSNSKVSADVVRQIKGLDDEKESRNPAQQKIDSQLIYASKIYRGQQVANGVPELEVEVGLGSDGYVVVDITAPADAEVLRAIKGVGGEVLLVSETYQSIRARVPITQLEAIAGLEQVRFIQPKQEAQISQSRLAAQPPVAAKSAENNISNDPVSLITQKLSNVLALNKTLPNGSLSTGSFASEGDMTHMASTVRGTFNIGGAGVKIGVLSDGVSTIAASQTSGDLGVVTVLAGQGGTGDKGTAMLEIVHDLAPGADLYFATSATSITSFAQNIRDLRTAGCDIIVDDTSYIAESPFQDGAPGVTNTNGGVVTQAVNDVVALGALYFSAASNLGNKNDSTSSTWEGDFVSGGTLAIVPGGGLVNDFDPSAAVAQSNIITLGGGTGVPINLSWADPLGASTNDYDLYILNNAGTAVSAVSNNTQNGTQDPYEQVSTNNTTGRRVVIRQKTGAANRFLHLDLNGGRATFSTGGEIHGHSAASGAYGVASTPAFTSDNIPPLLNVGPYPGAFNSANKVEPSSPDGPRRIFFQGNGTVITPGDLSSTGGQVLQQPTIAAADGVQVSGSGGNFITPFFGTSAAAAHAAAIAALIKSANSGFTPAQIKTALTPTAVDIETAGTDRDAGFGVIMPYPALVLLGVTGKAFLESGTVTATETCCNSNGLIERGETASLNVVLNNPGTVNATAMTSTLTTSTPGIAILSGSSAYPDLAATSGTATNTVPFVFQQTVFAADDVTVDFTLTVTYTGGWNATQVLNFSVETGRKPITTVLDATAPPINLSFPAATTGTQTNLVFPDDPASTCAAPTGFPGTLTSTTPQYDAYSIVNFTATARCATIAITADRSAAGAIQAVAYLGTFTPASVGTNYAADAGFTSIINPGLTAVFSVNVPAGVTLTVVVTELKSPGNNFPSAFGSTYKLKVSGIPVTLGPTAADVSVSGQVTAGARGIGRANVRIVDNMGNVRSAMTNPFGNFRFDGIEAGKTYIVVVNHKLYKFNPRVVAVNDSLTGLNFEAQ